MRKRSFHWLLVAGLATGTLWPSNDPLVGKWKLNPSKSKLTDRMKVEVAGPNKYALDFGGGVETIVADGTDEHGLSWLSNMLCRVPGIRDFRVCYPPAPTLQTLLRRESGVR